MEPCSGMFSLPGSNTCLHASQSSVSHTHFPDSTLGRMDSTCPVLASSPWPRAWVRRIREQDRPPTTCKSSAGLFHSLW